MMDFYTRSNLALDLAGDLALSFATTTPLLLRPKDEKLLQGMAEFRFGPDQSRCGWSIGTGPLVVCVHGYSGRGVQMAHLARQIAKAGFQAVIFDAGGHGSSRVESVGFNTFINDTRDITAHFGIPVHAFVGHSAGGLAMMRARALYGVTAEKYVILAAPLFPYPPLENMRKKGAPEQALDYLKPVIAAQFQIRWSALAQGKCYEFEPGKGLLAIFDREDDLVLHTDAEALMELWPTARIVKTDGYGHNRIVKSGEALASISDFLAG